MLKRKRKQQHFITLLQKTHTHTIAADKGRAICFPLKREIERVLSLVLLVTFNEVKFGLLSSAESAAATELRFVNACLEPATCTHGRMTRIFNVPVRQNGV